MKIYIYIYIYIYVDIYIYIYKPQTRISQVDQVYAAYSASQTRLLIVDIDLVLGASFQNIREQSRTVDNRSEQFRTVEKTRDLSSAGEIFGD